jgi:hypothetical protein
MGVGDLHREAGTAAARVRARGSMPGRYLLAAALLIAAAQPAFAVALEPGAWKEIETGTEDGKPVPPATNNTCFTPEEAEDPSKGFAPEKFMSSLRGQCKTLEATTSDKSLTMRVQCGEPDKTLMNFDMSYTFNSEHSYSGRVKYVATVKGKSTTSDKKIEGRWMSSICIKRRTQE